MRRGIAVLACVAGLLAATATLGGPVHAASRAASSAPGECDFYLGSLDNPEPRVGLQTVHLAMAGACLTYADNWAATIAKTNDRTGKVLARYHLSGCTAKEYDSATKRCTRIDESGSPAGSYAPQNHLRVGFATPGYYRFKPLAWKFTVDPADGYTVPTGCPRCDAGQVVHAQWQTRTVLHARRKGTSVVFTIRCSYLDGRRHRWLPDPGKRIWLDRFYRAKGHEYDVTIRKARVPKSGLLRLKVRHAPRSTYFATTVVKSRRSNFAGSTSRWLKV